MSVEHSVASALRAVSHFLFSLQFPDVGHTINTKAALFDMVNEKPHLQRDAARAAILELRNVLISLGKGLGSNAIDMITEDYDVKPSTAALLAIPTNVTVTTQDSERQGGDPFYRLGADGNCQDSSSSMPAIHKLSGKGIKPCHNHTKKHHDNTSTETACPLSMQIRSPELLRSEEYVPKIRGVKEVDPFDPSDEYRDDNDPGYRIRDLWEVDLIREIQARECHDPDALTIPYYAAFTRVAVLENSVQYRMGACFRTVGGPQLLSDEDKAHQLDAYIADDDNFGNAVVKSSVPTKVTDTAISPCSSTMTRGTSVRQNTPLRVISTASSRGPNSHMQNQTSIISGSFNFTTGQLGDSRLPSHSVGAKFGSSSIRSHENVPIYDGGGGSRPCSAPAFGSFVLSVADDDELCGASATTEFSSSATAVGLQPAFGSSEPRFGSSFSNEYITNATSASIEVINDNDGAEYDDAPRFGRSTEEPVSSFSCERNDTLSPKSPEFGVQNNNAQRDIVDDVSFLLGTPILKPVAAPTIPEPQIQQTQVDQAEEDDHSGSGADELSFCSAPTATTATRDTKHHVDNPHVDVELLSSKSKNSLRGAAIGARSEYLQNDDARWVVAYSDGNPQAHRAKKRKEKQQLLQSLSHPKSPESHFPIVNDNGIVIDSYNLKIVFERSKTGFEEFKEFQVSDGMVIAGRYVMERQIGQAAFSKALHCYDKILDKHVCMKVIRNDKDFVDQCLDEIKLLRYINYNADVDKVHCLSLEDFFYYKEHLIIVTELLKENLYEFGRTCRAKNQNYYTMGRIQKIASQILQALEYVHSLCLIHSDLKPENILIKDEKTCQVKLIDFGSSCFEDDLLTLYVQSRSYRAPEVLLGLPYDQKIDLWSLGCTLAELWTGYVLFQNDSVATLLARIVGIIGELPYYMVYRGQNVSAHFTQDGQLFEIKTTDHPCNRRGKRIRILLPKRSSLRQRMRTNDAEFIDFLRGLLEIDPVKRPTASKALQHPWLQCGRYPDGL